MTKQQIQKLKKRLLELEEEHDLFVIDYRNTRTTRLEEIISRFFMSYGQKGKLIFADLLKPLTAKERRGYPKELKKRRDLLAYELYQFFMEDMDDELDMIYALQQAIIEEAYKAVSKKANAKTIKNIMSRSKTADYMKANKEKQAAHILALIQTEILRGNGYQATIDNVLQKYDLRANTEEKRLAYTEDTFLVNEALKEASGASKYRYMTAGDDRVCEDCSLLHGMEFAYEEAVVGFNYPPMHPWCRCIAVPED